MDIIKYIMIYGGSALMLFNIIRHGRFIRQVQQTKSLLKDRRRLHFSMLLLILFLAGYLAFGIFGKPDYLVASILFGGSIFVYIVLTLMVSMVRHLLESEKQLHERYEELQRSRQLEQALKEAETASAAKTEFLSNMSHDIRTPMNAIIGFTHLASESDDPQQVKSYLKKIEDSSEHLLDLINDVLEMSRIESGRLELNEHPASLCEIMTSVRDLFAMQMEQKKLAFTVRAEHLRSHDVICDVNRLKRVLLNLVSNALKFTPEDGSVEVILSQLDGSTADADIAGRPA